MKTHVNSPSHAQLAKAVGHRCRRPPGAQAGFTLIELMITVAIVAILAAVALPAYNNYIMRGHLVALTNDLQAVRVKMEQYYQDNRAYPTSSTALANICPSPSSSSTPYSLACTATKASSTTTPVTIDSFTATATGSGIIAGAVYTITQADVKASTLPTAWGGTTASCWIMRKGGSC